MANSGLFNASYIERDSKLTGGNRVVAKIFGESLDFSGIIEPDGDRYVLKADIVPDQSRVFNDLKVRVDGVDYTDYEIRTREDGKRVVTVAFPLDPVSFQDIKKRIDVIWNYNEDDLNRPDIFKSTIVVNIGNLLYQRTELASGLTQYKGGYTIQADDFWKAIGDVQLTVNGLTTYYSGLTVRYYPNYKDYPTRFEVTNYDNRLSEIPFTIKKNVYVDLDTLKVQNKKFDLIWHTREGEQIETIMVDTDTLGWATGFSAPVPIEINLEAYPDIDLSSIYRNFVFQPEYKSYYKGNHELKGRNLSFKTKVPIELTLQDFKLSVLVNGSEVGYTTTPSTNNQYNYTQYDVPLSTIENIESVEVVVSALYPNASEVNYGVVFTELF